MYLQRVTLVQKNLLCTATNFYNGNWPYKEGDRTNQWCQYFEFLRFIGNAM